jgi:hypothetical protein
MRCSACQKENPDDARFCNGCGDSLETVTIQSPKDIEDLARSYGAPKINRGFAKKLFELYGRGETVKSMYWGAANGEFPGTNTPYGSADPAAMMFTDKALYVVVNQYWAKQGHRILWKNVHGLNVGPHKYIWMSFVGSPGISGGLVVWDDELWPKLRYDLENYSN